VRQTNKTIVNEKGEEKMQRKHYVLALLIALWLGSISAISLPVEAQEYPVRIWIEDWTDHDNIYPPKTPGPFAYFDVLVMIESPLSWFDTADGIVAFTLSVRVDPRVLEVNLIKPTDTDYDGDGFNDDFMSIYPLMYPAYSVLEGPEKKDLASGTMWGFALSYTPVPSTGMGGDPINGDDIMGLCELRFKALSNTIASPIDLIGAGGVIEGVNIEATVVDARGDKHVIEPEDGYYMAETPDISFLDLNQTASVIGSLWHELWPEFCQEWRIDSHEDTNEDGALQESEQIDMIRLADEYKAWYHVEWVNPDPIAGDGKADLIVLWKEDIPEFPLGIGLLMMVALAIPVVYLWRTRKKET